MGGENIKPTGKYIIATDSQEMYKALKKYKTQLENEEINKDLRNALYKFKKKCEENGVLAEVKRRELQEKEKNK